MMSETVAIGDPRYFSFVSGLWKGDKAPLAKAAVLRSTNFKGDGFLRYDDIAELDVRKDQLDSRKLQQGDIIIERSGGGPKQPVGRVALFNPPDNRAFATSNFTTVLRIEDHDSFEPQFVGFFLHALYLSGVTETMQRATTGIRNLDWAEYQSIEVPRLPIDDQRLIACFLRSVHECLDTQGSLLETLAALKRAAMLTLFTKGLRDGETRETEFGPVPAAWTEIPLDDCAFVQTGAAKGRKFADVEMVEVPYLRVANVQDGHLDLTEMKEIRIRKSEIERYRLQVGDVVLTEGGDFDKLGRGFIWRGELDLCVHQNHVFAVRPDRDKLVPEFFAYLAQSPYGKAYFLKVAHKTTNLACINSTKLKAFPVPVPPTLDEQREIVAILDAIDRKIDLHRRKRAVLDELFKALLHKLMTGEIRVADLDLSALSPDPSDSKTPEVAA